jgi:hypothetical protein
MKISQSDMEHIKEIKKLMSKAYDELSELSPEGYTAIEALHHDSYSLIACIRHGDFLAEDVIMVFEE